MDAKTKALMVIATDIKIRTFLRRNDPQALEQVEQALGANRPTPKTHPRTFMIALADGTEVTAEEFAAAWGCDPSYDKAPNLHGDGCLFYNFGVEGNDPEFLKKFIPAIDRTIAGLKNRKAKAAEENDKRELMDLKDEVQRRLRVLGAD